MAAQRSPWMNERATALVALMHDRYGWTLSDDDARAEVSDHLDHVAAMMRIGRQAAKFYVTDDTISELSDRIGREVVRKRTQQALPAARHLTLVPARHRKN